MATLAVKPDTPLVPPGVWEVDPTRSTIGFDVRHLLVTKVHGRFGEISGKIRCDGEGVASIDGQVAVASIDTGDPRRDSRLCSEEFFDARRHPTISLSAACPRARADNALIVRGTLTVRDASSGFAWRVGAAASPVHGSDDLRVHAGGVVSRRDLGLEWDSAFAAGGLMIDDRVALRVNIVVVRRTQPRALTRDRHRSESPPLAPPPRVITGFPCRR